MRQYIAFWKGFLDFSGVASRKEYWVPTLFNGSLGILSLAGLMALARDGVEPVTGVLIGLAVLYFMAAVVPSFAVQVRRLHDINRSGLWLLITLLPAAGDLILLAFSLLPSVVAGNRYRTQ